MEDSEWDDDEFVLQGELDELTYDDIADLYQQGINAYTAGDAPDGWSHPRANENPFLAGWNHAADLENGQKCFNANDTEVPRTGLGDG